MPFHGFQTSIVKLCPQQSDVAPRTYKLTVRRFPDKDGTHEYIGAKIFQTFLY